jgi:hypothetical protein
MRLAKIRRQGAVSLRSVQGHHLRYITEVQADQLKETKAGRWRSSKEFQLFLLEREERNSSAAISAGEMQTNAGLDGISRTAGLNEEKRGALEFEGQDPEDFIERTQGKIKAWPDIKWGVDPMRYVRAILATTAVQ